MMIVNEVKKFEEDFNIQLPTDYKNFLIQNDGKDLSFEYFPIEVDYYGEIIEFGILTLDSLIDVRLNSESIWEFIPENIDDKNVYISDADCFVFISTDVNSCAVLLGVKKEYFGKVYLLDKEPQETSMELRIFLIANSFGELLSRIQAR